MCMHGVLKCALVQTEHCTYDQSMSNNHTADSLYQVIGLKLFDC